MKTTQSIPGVRFCHKTSQYFPTVNGVDTSPTSFDKSRALQIAADKCNAKPVNYSETMKYTIEPMHGGTVFAVKDDAGNIVGYGKTLEIANGIKARAEKNAVENAKIIAAGHSLDW